MERKSEPRAEKPPAANVVRWLHISDLHFREAELWDRRATLRALIAKVGELKEQGLAPDVVFVTGDIAWSGKPKEYAQATRFFHELNKVLELDPKDRWFLVPGNHDVDRSRIKLSHRSIQSALTDEVTVEETLRDPETMRLLSTRLEAYYAFAANFLGPARALQPDRPWRTDVRELGGVSVGILQLNSAWIAEGGETDKANLLVGEAQVREALDATPDVSFRVALMHHDRENLRPFDRQRIESLLAEPDRPAFLLRGHLHANQTRIQYSPDGSLYEMAAGTLYTDEHLWPRGFAVGEVDLGKGEARIRLFRFSGESGGFFAPDNLTYKNAPDGVCRFNLPTACRISNKKMSGRKTASEAQRISVTVRYRQAAANYHGHARFIGFPNQATRPNARVSDLFVPLRMTVHARGTTATESRSTAQIAQRLLRTPKGVPARIVVLGDPGSGKTTLSRFLVMLAAGAISMPGVEVEGEPLPLRVAFRDFLEKRRENPNLSLIDYLELQANGDLSLTLPKGFLRNAIERGEAVLLLDGLDEVGAAEHRVAMRDLVAAFSAAHSRLPMLITSRIAGFDDAPLSEATFGVREFDVLVPFQVLVLEKFNDDDLRTFVSQWYGVQEPDDPVARDRDTAALLAALNADERVRELARTPILATLIAMIHRVEATLPGERAKLYELCVRMLLETWPAQAKRPFAQIDTSLQRAYLESLAFDAQTRRESRSRDAVTFTRFDLVNRLLPILRKRDFVSAPEWILTRLVERWIDHLEQQTGILIEQSPGVYAFFHLSIMEYLAARGMERELGRDAVVDTIATHFGEAGWREVCLLAVGVNAEDGAFLDRVYGKVAASKNHYLSDFLLRCLREEARFQPRQRETIVAEYAAGTFERDPWLTAGSLIGQICKFSVRHGEAVRNWIDDRLDHASIGELESIVAVTLQSDALSIVGRLEQRTDRAAAAGALLEFWPGSALGEWAAETVEAAAALTWSLRAPHDLAPLRALAALRELPAVSAAMVVNLNVRTLSSCAEWMENFRVADGLPLPAHIRVEPSQGMLATLPRMPIGNSPHIEVSSLRFARPFARTFARRFAESLSQGGILFSTEWAMRLVHQFAGDGTSASMDGFARQLAAGLSIHDVDIPTNFVNVFGLDLTGARLDPKRKGREPQPVATNILATMAGEGWLAAASATRSRNVGENVEYMLLRVQNRWLFEFWNEIDQRFSDHPTPAQHALYLALGWAQSTTTWAWPDSHRWRTLFEAGPGEHWLVRSQWHLCKLTDDPKSKSDKAALRAAIRDGHRDETLPGYAARLGEILGIEQA